MSRISQRYDKLKTIFSTFAELATSHLVDDKCPVKGITFLPQLDNNYFDVCFAGKTVRFSFSIAEDSMGFVQGVVRCAYVRPDGKPLDEIIGEFSFNGHGETSLKTADDDPLCIELLPDTAEVVLRFLSDAVGKK